MMMMMKWLCNADEDVEVMIMTVLRITIRMMMIMMISLMMTMMIRVVMVTLMRMIMMMGIMMMMMLIMMMVVVVVVVGDGVVERSSVYKSSWGRVDSKGLYGRWRSPLIAFWSAIFPFSKG